MIAAALGGAGARAGMPDLALDLRLVNCLELDGHNFLTGHSVPPITARGDPQKMDGAECPSPTYLIIISLSLNNVNTAQRSQNISRPCWRVHKKWSKRPRNKKDKNKIKTE